MWFRQNWKLKLLNQSCLSYLLRFQCISKLHPKVLGYEKFTSITYTNVSHIGLLTNVLNCRYLPAPGKNLEIKVTPEAKICLKVGDFPLMANYEPANSGMWPLLRFEHLSILYRRFVCPSVGIVSLNLHSIQNGSAQYLHQIAFSMNRSNQRNSYVNKPPIYKGDTHIYQCEQTRIHIYQSEQIVFLNVDTQISPIFSDNIIVIFFCKVYTVFISERPWQ